MSLLSSHIPQGPMSLPGCHIPQGTAYEVPMNDVDYILYGIEDLTSIGTANLNGCSVVMIVSKLGAILANVAPLPIDHANNPNAGEINAKSMMNVVEFIYMAHQPFFPPGTKSWVLCAAIDGDVGLPDQQRIFQSTLTNLGLPCTLKTYTPSVTSKTTGTLPGQGTVSIQGAGSKPVVYIENIDVTV